MKEQIIRKIQKPIITTFIQIGESKELRSEVIFELLEAVADGPVISYEIDSDTADELVKNGILEKRYGSHQSIVYSIGNKELYNILYTFLISDKNVLYVKDLEVNK